MTSGFGLCDHRTLAGGAAAAKTPGMLTALGRPCYRWRAWRRGVVLGALAAVAAGAAVLPREQVAIVATTAPEYVRPLGADGRPAAQSYVFLPGHFFGGRWIYSVLQRLKFEELLPALATGLQQQNYLPAREPAAADLIIVVHWGVTDVAEDAVPPQERVTDLNRQFGEMAAGMRNLTPGAVAEANEFTLADAGRLNEITREFDVAGLDQRVSTASNAVLLGYASTLARERARPWPSVEERRMTAELNEGRYFVILMAYERQPATPDRKGRPLWVTRLSIRAPGTNFLEAFPVLVHAGGQVFGRQTDGVVRVQPKAAVPGVKLGELEILGTVERPVDREAKAP